ncbi:MAG: glycoside hydrolase family 25 protein [Rhodobacteraceae bacterium]|nr:glycoside hydrolase family 25 protein [Paracoccaceae bacterium]
MRVFVALLIAVFVTACTAPSTPVIQTAASKSITNRPAPQFGDSDPYEWTARKPWTYAIHGIDVARYQNRIDWEQVRRANVSFAYIKATEGGDHLDERFTENWRAARRAGVLRGAYHYYYFCRTAAEQARWFIRNVPRDAKMLPPVLDIEWNPRSPSCKLRPEPSKVRREMRVFLERISKHYGKRPVIYATPDYYQDNQLWRVSGYDFWLRSVADHPSDRYPGRKWAFWQYTSTGVVPGIEGDADINAFKGSAEQWQAWLAANGVAP